MLHVNKDQHLATMEYKKNDADCYRIATENKTEKNPLTFGQRVRINKK